MYKLETSAKSGITLKTLKRDLITLSFKRSTCFYLNPKSKTSPLIWLKPIVP